MKQIFKICLFALTVLNPGNGIKSALQIVQMFRPEYKMSDCLEALISNQNLSFAFNLQISVESESLTVEWTFGDIIDRFLATNHFDMRVDLRGTSSNKSSPYDLHIRMLFVDTFEALRTLVNHQRTHDHDLSGENQYYYIILPPGVQLNNLQGFLRQIMDFCFTHFIIHVNVLVEEAQDLITAYTYYPFTKNQCKNLLPVVQNRFINSRLEGDDPAFPPKLNNFWECPLLAVLSEEPPFIVFEDNTVTGIDGSYLKTLAGIMNFSIEAVLDEGSGKTSANGTVNGAFKLMEDGNGDFMFGGAFCSVHRMQRFASTTDYFTTALRLIVKEPSAYSSIEVLLFPFDWYTWFTLFVVLMGKWVGEVVWKRITGNMIGFEEHSARLRILPWLFSILILRSSYEGLIFKFLHNRPRRELPTDLEGALADGYTIYARSTYFTALKQFTDFTDRFTFIDGPFHQLLEEFDKHEGKYAFITLGELFSVNSSESSKYRRIFTVKKPILQNILCVYLPKFSFLTQELNKRIKQLKNFGYMKRLYEKSGVHDDDPKRKDDDGYVNIMSLNQLMGAFQLLVGLMVVAVFVFVVEVISEHNPGLKSVVELFH